MGADRIRTVSVQLISATDADLEAAIEDGRFRAPLLYRLATHEMRIAPLRDRRDDIGRLLAHVLTAEVGTATHLLNQRSRDDRLWLPASVVARMCLHDWPGNVRQLRNVARYLATAGRQGKISKNDRELIRLLDGATSQNPVLATTIGALPGTKAQPALINDDTVYNALKEHDWRLGRTAQALGMARATLNERIDKHATVRRAQSFSETELAAACLPHQGDLDAMWRALGVSKRSLKLRLNALGIGR